MCKDISDEWDCFLSVHRRVVLHSGDQYSNVCPKNYSSAVTDGQPSQHIQSTIHKLLQHKASPWSFPNKIMLDLFLRVIVTLKIRWQITHNQHYSSVRTLMGHSLNCVLNKSPYRYIRCIQHLLCGMLQIAHEIITVESTLKKLIAFISRGLFVYLWTNSIK